jgi:bifunctional non-homologous end joining protein LigD
MRHVAPTATSSPRGEPGRLRVTHPERVIDASTGLTKMDLVRYYASVAGRILPHLKGRAVAEVRGPQGIGKPLFFQRNDPAGPAEDTPLQVRTVEQLLAAAQLNVIEFHTGNCLLRTPDKPDRIVFDLDPGEHLAWPRMQEGAQLVRGMLQELKLESWLKTSGGKGLHVVVPIAARWPAETVRALSKAVVEHLASTLPDRFVAKSGADNRVGKIFVDYLRNNTIATTVAAFSARARPGLGVSMPVSWDELPELESGAHWTVQTAPDHLAAEKADPWRGYFQAKQSMATGLKTLGVKLARQKAG